MYTQSESGVGVCRRNVVGEESGTRAEIISALHRHFAPSSDCQNHPKATVCSVSQDLCWQTRSTALKADEPSRLQSRISTKAARRVFLRCQERRRNRFSRQVLFGCRPAPCLLFTARLPIPCKVGRQPSCMTSNCAGGNAGAFFACVTQRGRDQINAGL